MVARRIKTATIEILKILARVDQVYWGMVIPPEEKGKSLMGIQYINPYGIRLMSLSPNTSKQWKLIDPTTNLATQQLQRHMPQRAWSHQNKCGMFDTISMGFGIRSFWFAHKILQKISKPLSASLVGNLRSPNVYSNSSPQKKNMLGFRKTIRLPFGYW